MIETSGDQATRENALQFLDEMESRHDFLLNELDKLNASIETVLSEYTKSRQGADASPAATEIAAGGEMTGETVELSSDHD